MRKITCATISALAAISGTHCAAGSVSSKETEKTSVSSAGIPFSWDGATVYFLITDRFCNGDPSNDVNYGRKTDYGSERMNAATFHGGDFKGVTLKAKEGYFKELGVDVLWLTDVYEQIHGWMSGSGEVNDFPHYGYHGYYPLDFTQTDKNYGTVEELRELIDTLHNQGIRVMLGANLNNPGYPTLLDAVQYGFTPVGLTEEEAAEHIKEWSYDGFYAGRVDWKGWYDRGWIRMPDENWDENNPLEATLYGLPDFKDESTERVAIPAFLKNKWKSEGSRNDAWVNPSARRLRKNMDTAPLDYVIAWIASWVEEFGIDGFRCDIVENVRLDRWKQLNEACNDALDRWRAAHPESPASKWTDKFYMTGDYENASIDYKPDYAEAGFSSLVNFFFPKKGDLDDIVYTWQVYSDSLNARLDWAPFSYLNNSYHRDADASNMADCAVALLLAPGAVQLFYGDESGRGLSDARFNVDSNQAFRSDMNWENMDEGLLQHFRRLGRIRKENPVIATGRQRTIDVHTCLRENDEEKVLIKVRPDVSQPIKVAGVWPEGMEVEDLCTGRVARVEDGQVTYPAYIGNVAILKAKTK